MINGVIFDLDDTLYPEYEYTLSGFQHIANLLSLRAEPSCDDIYSILRHIYETGDRRRVFDELLHTVPYLKEVTSIPALVNEYRSHLPAIRLSDECHGLLTSLRDRCFLGIITDGYAIAQMQKIKALGLADMVDEVVVTDKWGREYWKPHPKAYQYVQMKARLPAEQMVYVADNPLKDFVTPNRLGWMTVRLRMPGRLHSHLDAATFDHEAIFVCNSISELRAFCSGWCAGYAY